MRSRHLSSAQPLELPRATALQLLNPQVMSTRMLSRSAVSEINARSTVPGAELSSGHFFNASLIIEIALLPLIRAGGSSPPRWCHSVTALDRLSRPQTKSLYSSRSSWSSSLGISSVNRMIAFNTPADFEYTEKSGDVAAVGKFRSITATTCDGTTRGI